MDKKIINLVICILIILIAIAGLIIYSLVPQKNDEPKKEETGLSETVIDAPLGDDGFRVYTSSNGYTIKYPDGMEAKKMATAIDFILEDEKSGSSINVVTAKNDGSLKTMSRDEYEHSFLESTMAGTELLSYEGKDINGSNGTVAKFTYNGNDVTQIIIIKSDCGYNITVTKSPVISDEMSFIFDGIVNSFTAN